MHTKLALVVNDSPARQGRTNKGIGKGAARTVVFLVTTKRQVHSGAGSKGHAELCRKAQRAVVRLLLDGTCSVAEETSSACVVLSEVNACR